MRTPMLALVPLTLTLLAAGQDQKPILCRGNYHSEADAVKQLSRLAATYSNLEEWKARAASIRKQILVGAKLDPLPDRTLVVPSESCSRLFADQKGSGRVTGNAG